MNLFYKESKSKKKYLREGDERKGKRWGDGVEDGARESIFLL